MSSPDKAPLKVGVLIVDTVQLLDLAAIDLFGMMVPEYLRSCGLPDAIVAQGTDFEFHYITERGPQGPGPVTSNVNLYITDSFDSVGKLDYLFIPGPLPTYYPSAGEQEFIRTKAKEVRALLSVCSGVFPVMHSGILAGKRATGPRSFLPTLKQKGPDVLWTEKRWEVDEEGKIWTSAAVTNGCDMMAAYIRKNFAPELANLICEFAHVGDRGQEYPA